jgi:hypothetical protein
MSLTHRFITISLCVGAVGFTGPASAQSFGASIASWFAQTQNATSAVAVDTKQVSLSAEQLSASTQASVKALAQTISSYEAKLAYTKALNQASDALTSAGELCAAVDVASATRSAGEVADIVRAGTASAEEQWRSGGGDLGETYEMQLEMRKEVYCSAAEFEAGLCGGETNTAAEPPAGDTNAAEWMLTRSYGSSTAVNGSNYIDTVAALPTVIPPDEAAGDVNKQMQNLMSLQDIARLSVARGAMADVVARGTEGD